MHTNNRFNTALCVGLLSASGGALFAAPSPADTAETKYQTGDREFLEQALGVNQLELQLGQLASHRATTAEVKSMGQKMVEKHTELGQQLATLAWQAGGSRTAALSSDQRVIYDRVASQSGSAFDAEFKEVVNAGHVKELAMYRDEVNRATSPRLRDLAQYRVTTLEKTIARANAATSAPAPTQEW